MSSSNKVEMFHMESGDWVSDGIMTEQEAEKHIKRCEYKEHGIEYKTKPIKPKTKRKSRAAPKDTESDGEL